MSGTGGRSKLSAGTEIISARLCGLYLSVVRSGTVKKFEFVNFTQITKFYDMMFPGGGIMQRSLVVARIYI